MADVENINNDVIKKYNTFFTDIRTLAPFVLSSIYVINYVLEYYFFSKEKISFSFIEFTWQNFVQNALVIFLTLFCSIFIGVSFSRLINPKFFNIISIFLFLLWVMAFIFRSLNNYFQIFFDQIILHLLGIFSGSLSISFFLKKRDKFFLIYGVILILLGIISLQLQFLEKQNYYYISYKINGESYSCRVFRIYNSRLICTNGETASVNDFNRNYSLMYDKDINSFSVLDLNKIEEISFIPFANSEIDTLRVFNLINKHRKDNDLKPLNISNLLNKAAQEKSEHMIKNKYFKHISPDGVKWSDFIKNINYDYDVAGENLATGFSSADSLVDAWMKSPGHRENILNSSVEEFGMASVSSDNEPSKVTMFFGKLVNKLKPN